MGTKTQKLSNVVDQIVQWQSVVVADGSTNTTAVTGRGYFIDNSSATHTINLPSSPNLGDTVSIIALSDAGVNNITVGRNGSNIQGSASDYTINSDNQSDVFVYSNASEGWTVQSTTTEVPTYVTATGGTITTSGDFKIHTFTGDGCFVVSNAGNTGGSNIVDYLVVAGGGSGGPGYAGGGGGAGGFRVSNGYGLPAPTTSPLATPTGIIVSATTYPVTVGAGGSGGTGGAAITGPSGSNSVFSTITSAGGGGGGTGGLGGGPNPNAPASGSAGNGGSGGGAGSKRCDSTNVPQAGTGNTPVVSPPQGNPGGSAGADGFSSFTQTAGGGGAGGAGQTSPNQPTPASGGVGSYISPSFAVGCAGTSGPVCGVRYFAGGGGGGTDSGVPGVGGSGGGGPGSVGPTPGTGTAGTTNTGGGGGGAQCSGNPGSPYTSGAGGGSGIVIIRYKFQN